MPLGSCQLWLKISSALARERRGLETLGSIRVPACGVRRPRRTRLFRQGASVVFQASCEKQPRLARRPALAKDLFGGTPKSHTRDGYAPQSVPAIISLAQRRCSDDVLIVEGDSRRRGRRRYNTLATPDFLWEHSIHDETFGQIAKRDEL